MTSSCINITPKYGAKTPTAPIFDLEAVSTSPWPTPNPPTCKQVGGLGVGHGDVAQTEIYCSWVLIQGVHRLLDYIWLEFLEVTSIIDLTHTHWPRLLTWLSILENYWIFATYLTRLLKLELSISLSSICHPHITTCDLHLGACTWTSMTNLVESW